jgi:hypothetical protein
VTRSPAEHFVPLADPPTGYQPFANVRVSEGKRFRNLGTGSLEEKQRAIDRLTKTPGQHQVTALVREPGHPKVLLSVGTPTLHKIADHIVGEQVVAHIITTALSRIVYTM